MSNDLANNKAHGQHDSATDYASEVFEKSSVCAVSTILSTDNKPRKIFRSVIFLLFTVAFLYQCIAFLCYALQHPAVVDFETFRPEKFVSPAYTFCNFNTIKRSKFCEKYPGNCTKPDKEFWDENPRFCGTPDTQILNGESILDLDDLEELYQFNHDAEDMVDFRPEHEHNPVGPLPRTNPNEMGSTACFSYYGRVDSSLDPLMKIRHPVGVGFSDMFSFDPQENELAYPEAMSGMMFDVHSPFEAANPFETGFFMKPGYLYRVMVKMTQEELLPNECLNYTEIWLKNDRTGYRSQAACRHKCMGDTLLKCFNCTDPMLLYPYPNVRFCQGGKEKSTHKAGCEDPEAAVLECIIECKDDCLKMKFSYEVQENFLNRYALHVERNESRLIRVTVEFPDMNIQKTIHKPQFQIMEVFSLIGGLLAFWIGLSMVQIVEVFDCIFQIGKHLIQKRSTGSESSAA